MGAPMMLRRSIPLAGLALLCAAAAVQAAPRRGLMLHEPMIFFVATGAPNACGPGCSTWIAAEGTFDPQAPVRLKEFLGVAGRRDLPIFFHSPGGELQPSINAGQVLRDFRMTAGIGQTLPDGCRDAARADDACRKLMRSGQELKASLRVARGICASGCAYALVGASTRLIGEGAKFGVHASRAVPRPEVAHNTGRRAAAARESAESQSYDVLRHYVTIAGVDPALIDLASRTPHQNVHWLSREELERFGVIPGDFFETRWFRHPKSDGGLFIIKSVTQPVPMKKNEYRTVNIGIDCGHGRRAIVSLRRETAGEDSRPVLKLSAGDAFAVVFRNARRQGEGIDLHLQPVTPDALMRLAGSDRFVLREERESWSREIRLSTRGLMEAMASVPGRCGRQA
jgi:hypothetical protein